MSDDNPYIIPEMDQTLRKQIQECNWQVVNVTTPANYFHVLRRQVGAANLLIIFLACWQIFLPFCYQHHHFVKYCLHLPRYTGNSVNLWLWYLQRTCFGTRTANQICPNLMMSKATLVLTNRVPDLSVLLRIRMTTQILRRVSDV